MSRLACTPMDVEWLTNAHKHAHDQQLQAEISSMALAVAPDAISYVFILALQSKMRSRAASCVLLTLQTNLLHLVLWLQKCFEASAGQTCDATTLIQIEDGGKWVVGVLRPSREGTPIGTIRVTKESRRGVRKLRQVGSSNASFLPDEMGHIYKGGTKASTGSFNVKGDPDTEELIVQQPLKRAAQAEGESDSDIDYGMVCPVKNAKQTHPPKPSPSKKKHGDGDDTLGGQPPDPDQDAQPPGRRRRSSAAAAAARCDAGLGPSGVLQTSGIYKARQVSIIKSVVNA